MSVSSEQLQRSGSGTGHFDYKSESNRGFDKYVENGKKTMETVGHVKTAVTTAGTAVSLAAQATTLAVGGSIAGGASCVPIIGWIVAGISLLTTAIVIGVQYGKQASDKADADARACGLGGGASQDGDGAKRVGGMAGTKGKEEAGQATEALGGGSKEVEATNKGEVAKKVESTTGLSGDQVAQATAQQNPMSAPTTNQGAAPAAEGDAVSAPTTASQG